MCIAYSHLSSIQTYVRYLLSVLLLLFPVHISRMLFNAIRQVETGGECDPQYAVGDGGTSFGPYQIRKNYYNDAVEYNPYLLDDGKSFQNVRGPGSNAYSKMVIQAYMDRYATERRLGHPATDEDIARIHNGGPNGFRKHSTLKYWRKVQAYL